ncbi:MAG: hypothetical protein QGG39_04930 [Candidatus Poribacteria bacterium]|nr:hypothetical protein [Candidatus Poribacteria bacterium]
MRLFFVCLAILGINMSGLWTASSAPNGITSQKLEMKMLEVAYLFEEGKGKTAQDISPNKRHGTLEGGVKYGPGKFGTGLIYDGIDDNLTVKGYRGVGGSNARTVLYWFKSASARDHSWVKWGSGEQTMKYYVRGHLDGAKCYLRVENAGGNNWGDADVCDGKWHHHAVVFPAGAKNVQDHKIYVDGKLNAKFGAAKELNTDIETQEVAMGAKLLHHTFMHGSFDEAAIFNVALTDKQIQLIISQGLASALGGKPTAVEAGNKLPTNWAVIKASY